MRVNFLLSLLLIYIFIAMSYSQKAGLMASQQTRYS